MQNNPSQMLRKIAFIGNYLPRQCGIATFTTDLCESVAAQFPESNIFTLAMNDQPEGYAYPERVRFEIPQDDLSSYRAAADFLNLNNVDLVCVQHEFGIYGGKAGSHLLTLLNNVQAPIVTTLHTIPAEPTPDQSLLMRELIHLSDRLVVMSEHGRGYLQDIYKAPAGKIDLIHHGIPDVPFVDPNFYKDKFKVDGKPVLLTFGLLSANKGIEYVIRAMPDILAEHPDVVYLVLGATHPNVRRHEGERYRSSLENLAKELGVQDQVIFYNQFVSLEELVEFIGASDIYITPYLNPDQIVSGTLAYTVGAGKAVISTPYSYATELLDEGRGRIVPFRDPAAIAEQVLQLLNDESERHATRKRAYQFGRQMIWPEAARQYMATFERAVEEHTRRPAMSNPYYPANEVAAAPAADPLPPLNLAHLLRLTDQTGMLQHAVFHIPNYAEGYSIDDNARALILAVMLQELVEDHSGEIAGLAERYLAFIKYAYNPENKRFRNMLGYDRNWLEDAGSEDSHGRTLWSLGCVIGHSQDESLQNIALDLFDQALPTSLEFTSPRSWAFTLLGIDEYLRRFSGDRAVFHAGEILAEKLFARYQEARSPGWEWCEDSLTYNNATLPHALFLASRRLSRPEMEEAALASLRWLAGLQTGPKGYFKPIGNQGFYQRAGEIPDYDQQPLEAGAMVAACLDVYRSLGDPFWLKEAQRAFDWFLGKNDIGIPVYDSRTGGCRDGLHPNRLNHNQGAESTLAFLMSLVDLYLLEPTAFTSTHFVDVLPAAGHPPRGGSW